MKKRITLPIFIALLIVGAVAVLWALLFYLRTPGPWKQVTIATATPGGTYYLLGDELAGILDRLPGKPIERAVAEQSAGAVKNIELLMDPNSEANVAFVMKSALLQAGRDNPETRQELRILARLYRDVVQIVVRRDTNIETTDFRKFFQKNKNRKIFIGPERSGTRLVTKQILESIGFSEGDYTADDATTKFSKAADGLIDRELDAAFFMAGTPTQAVQRALESGECKLLSLDAHARERLASEGSLGLVKEEIRGNFYPNQPDSVQTVAADVFLVCRSDLDKDLAFVILEALFDNITGLLLVHTKAQEIKLTDAFEFGVLKGFELHPGAKKFQKKEEEKLLIATGALNGKYYQLGETIQYLLELRGIPCRLTHTDGSLENADLLKKRLEKRRPTIAIMQIDAAIACLGEPKLAYGVGVSNEGIPKVKDIVAIAGLHKEQAHVVARRDKLTDIAEKLKWDPNAITTLSKLAEAISIRKLPEEKLKVCFGPKNSATRLVARAIFEHHGIESNDIEESPLSVSDMVSLLDSGEIDVGFFVSHVPSKAMRNILNSEKVWLLSLGSGERATMTERVFKTSTIDPNEYKCQKKDEVIETISTRAVLVTTKDLPSDVVKAITETIHKWRTLLPVDIEEKEMIEGLSPLPLHTGAEAFYKKAGLLPSELPYLHRLQKTWYILGCLTMLITVMLIPAYTGLIILRRSRTGNEIGRRILGIPIEASARDSVQRLLKIRDEIQERVRRRWWKWGELDKHRWRYLRDLIHDRIGEAKENLTRTFVAEIRDVARNPELGKATRKQRYRSIEDRILEYFEKAELDPSQQKMLRELLRETSRQDTKTKESKGIKK